MKPIIVLFLTFLVAFFMGRFFPYGSKDQGQNISSNKNLTNPGSEENNTSKGNFLRKRLQSNHPDLYEEYLSEGTLIEFVFEPLTAKNPTEAAELLNEIQDENNKILSTLILLANWGDSDPTAAYHWLEEQRSWLPKEQYEGMKEGILLSVGKKDPEQAIAFMKTFSEGYNMDAIVASIADGWAVKDPSAGFEWLVSLNDKEVSSHALEESYKSLMLSYIDVDPKAVADIVFSLKSERLQSAIAPNLIANLALQDMDLAIDWAGSLKSAEARQTTYLSLIENSAIDAPEKALDIALASSGEDPAKQLIAEAFSLVSLNNLETALQKLETISDDSSLVIATQSVVSHWNDSDPEGLKKWLDDLPVGKQRDGAMEALFISQDSLGAGASAVNQISNKEKKFELVMNYARNVELSKLQETKQALQEIDLPSSGVAEISQVLDKRIEEFQGELFLPNISR